jgi:hypothetical protein
MHYRYLSVVATIVAGSMIACSDAAVDHVTAPRSTVTPAAPVANEWPTEDELAAAGMPSGIGFTISSNAWFEDNNRSFVAQASVHFEWVNEASARLHASLLNPAGATVNSGSAEVAYKRVAVPVSRGDTTLTVRISTNNVTCGLLGKHNYSGRGALNALDASLIQIVLFQKQVGETNGADVPESACPPSDGCEEPVARVTAGTMGILASESTDCEDDAPAPPGGGHDEIEVCYAVWVQIWVFDWARGTFWLLLEYFGGVFCYMT